MIPDTSERVGRLVAGLRLNGVALGDTRIIFVLSTADGRSGLQVPSDSRNMPEETVYLFRMETHRFEKVGPFLHLFRQ